MLKTIVPLENLIPERLGVSDNEIDRFNIGENGKKYAKKLGKLFKSGKSKSEKTTKSGKKLSKIRNLTNFDATENESKFLTPNVRTAFNRLRLAFTKALIF